MPRKSLFAYAKSLGKKALRKTFLGFARKEKTLGNKRFIKKKENGTPYTFDYYEKNKRDGKMNGRPAKGSHGKGLMMALFADERG